MEIREYLSKLKNGLTYKGNQSAFVTDLFQACGSNHFLPEQRNSSTQKNLFKGRPLTGEMKASFPRPFRTNDLAGFIEKYVGSTYVKIFDEFQISSNSRFDKHFVALTLAQQFKVFVESDKSDVPDIIAPTYQNFLDNPSATQRSMDETNVPLHVGDRVDLINQAAKNYTVGMNKKFLHHWKLKNSGKVEWRNRKLLFVNNDKKEVRVKAIPSEIVIPDIKPGKFVDIETEFDSRAFEGVFTTMWKMVDQDGNDCFPNQKWLFDVIIKVEFRLED